MGDDQVTRLHVGGMGGMGKGGALKLNLAALSEPPPAVSGWAAGPNGEVRPAWHCDYSEVTLGHRVGAGAFGEVYQASLLTTYYLLLTTYYLLLTTYYLLLTTWRGLPGELAAVTRRCEAAALPAADGERPYRVHAGDGAHEQLAPPEHRALPRRVPRAPPDVDPLRAVCHLPLRGAARATCHLLLTTDYLLLTTDY